MAETLHTEPFSIERLAGNPRRHRRERAVRSVLLGAALVTVLVAVLIVWSLVRDAWLYVAEVDPGSLWTTGWFPRRGIFDVRTWFVGSLVVTVVAMVIAGPIGLASAVYLSEYASPRVRRVLKPALEVLAGIPSVVLGYFALTWIAPNLVQRVLSVDSQSSLLVAGIGVGILTIPLVASISEDAMAAVPKALREASAGLGARRMTTSLRVVLPAAVSGLTAAFIVAISRAIGETMVVFIAGGGGDSATFTASPTDPGMTMTSAMASLAKGTDQVAGSGLAYRALFFVGFLLFVVTLLLNLVADRFVRRVRERY
jgi:phosphate transport system permease protein